MNKKGFTLIELIVTIALIGLVGIVLSMNMIKLVNEQKENKKEEFKSIIEEAACAYVILSDANWNGWWVEGDDLVEDGMLDEQINGYNVADYRVNTVLIDGRYWCTLEGEV